MMQAPPSLITCPKCGKVLLRVEGGAAELVIEFECIPDGATSLHPLTVKNARGVIVAEWPEAVELGRPVAFDAALFEREMQKGGLH